MKLQNIIAMTIIVFSSIVICSNISAQCVSCDGNSNPVGNYSSVLGMSANASGQAAFASGLEANALGNYSLALGKYVTSNGSLSFTIGSYLETLTSPAMIIGCGSDNNNKLTNNVTNSLVIGFNSNKPTLFVKGAPGNNFTGSIGIGDITNPLAKLHIKADNGEEAMVFVEPYAFTSAESAKLRLGTVDYGVSAGYGRLFFVTGGNYIFNSSNAKVGIGTLTPIEKLEVAGNVKITSGYAITSKVQAIDNKGLSLTNTGGTGITIANDGRVGIGTITAPSERLDVNGKVKSTSLQITTGYFAGYLLQSDNSGNALWTEPAWTISGSNVYRVAAGYVGIGTFSPSEKLDIIGTVKATSMYTNTGILIVGKDNYTGTDFTEITDPQFEVRSQTENNRKSANFVDSDGRRIFLVPKIYNGYNPIASVNDAGIFWSDSQAQGSNQNEYSGFVIGPHRDGVAKGIKIDKDGNVGIGKAVPTAMLDVNGDAKIGGLLESNNINVSGTIDVNTLEADIFNITQLNTVTFSVTDILYAGEIHVQNISEWKDCVFEKSYKLMSLKETEAFIKQNKHLPGIPSEKEVLDNGINVSEMNALLLQKIEELTLHIIELEKRLNNIENN